MKVIDKFMKNIWFWTRQISGPPSYKPLDDKIWRSILEYAYEKWIRIFDTAPIYWFWKWESLLWDTFKNQRQTIKIISKFWIWWDAYWRTSLECTPDSVKKELEDSLKRLKTNYIDIYLLHIPNPHIEIERIIKTLNTYKKTWVIKSYGVCNTYETQLKDFINHSESEIEYIEDFYNIVERKAENLIFPNMKIHQKFIAYSPLYRWLLTQWTTKELLEKNEEGINRLIKNQNLAELIKKKTLYSEIANRKGISVEKLALDFLLQKEKVDTVLFWTTKKEHLDFFLSLTQA